MSLVSSEIMPGDALWLPRVLATRCAELRVPVCWAAYSGGMDSTVLLHLLAHHALLPTGTALRAIHVHHGLHAHADAWVAHAETQCRAWGVALTVVRVDARAGAGESPEAAAREARYRAFEQHLGAGDVLLTAHHADDQAETFLLRALRGAGPAGLTAMPARRGLGRGELFRPLLDASRQQLHTYAVAQGLTWVDDSSNQQIRFDRNFLRHQVMPLLQSRWPDAVTQLGRVAALQAERWAWDQALLAQGVQAAQDAEGRLSASALRVQPAALQAEWVRCWLSQQHIAPIPARKLTELLHQMLHARADAMPCVTWRGGEVRRYREWLYAMQPLAPVPADAQVVWSGEAALPLAWGGVLQACARTGKGALVRLPTTLRVTPRGVHEGRAPELRKLWQARGIPPWQRVRWPLLWHDSTLVAAPGVWVAEAYRAGEHEVGTVFSLSR
jgi:tRNA(Ile)-lysidine synthase